MGTRFVSFAIAIAFSLVSAGLYLLVVGDPAARADGGSPDVIKLYKSNCATCHGLDGKGQTSMGKKVGTKDWTDGKTLKAVTDVQIRQFVREGRKGKDGKQTMPPNKKLTDDQVNALIQYARSFDHR